MPYDRDEVVTSVIDFYTFLATQLHFQLSELKAPPPAGWPQINKSRFAFLGKTDMVLDLLRHLPYLPAGSEKKYIYDHTICEDYMDEGFLTTQAKFGDQAGWDPLEPELEENCPWEKVRDKERSKHIVILAEPECGTKGSFIFLDTLDGELAVWDIMEGQYSGFDNAKDCFAWLKREFEDLKVFPVPNEVEPLGGEPELRNVIKSFGWPPKGDGSGWKREKCMKEMERLADKRLEEWRRVQAKYLEESK